MQKIESFCRLSEWQDPRSFPQFGMALSERELEGLPMITEGLSNQDIAYRLVVERSLREGVGKRHYLNVTNRDEFRNQARQAPDQFFAMFCSVVAIAILVGALGMVNTLTMSLLERRREMGMLRRVGMT